MIPYGRQEITDADIAEVEKVLRSDFLTQGPTVPRFEQYVSKYCNVKYAVAYFDIVWFSGNRYNLQVILRWIAMIHSANFIMMNFALRLTSSISPSLIFRFAFSLVKLWRTLGQIGVMDSTLFRSKSDLI